MRKDNFIQVSMLAGFLAILLWWEIGGRNSLTGTGRWGVPSTILGIIAAWVYEGDIWIHVWSTLSVAVIGLALGSILGIGLAFLFYSVHALGSTLTPVMAWLNSLPRILLVPIFIAALGIGITAKLAMVVTMTLFLFFFNVINGLNNIDERIMLNARLLGAKGIQVFHHVHLPLLGSWIIASMRTALGFAFIGAIISEYFGAATGLGYVVDLAYGNDRYDQAVSGLLVIFIVVGMLDFLVRKLERRWFYSSNP
jgi:NitT/TauT family transport system permease protein